MSERCNRLPGLEAIILTVVVALCSPKGVSLAPDVKLMLHEWVIDYRKDKASQFDPLRHVGNLDIVVIRVGDDVPEPYYVGQVQKSSIFKDVEVNIWTFPVDVVKRCRMS